MMLQGIKIFKQKKKENPKEAENQAKNTISAIPEHFVGFYDPKNPTKKLEKNVVQDSSDWLQKAAQRAKEKAAREGKDEKEILQDLWGVSNAKEMSFEGPKTQVGLEPPSKKRKLEENLSSASSSKAKKDNKCPNCFDSQAFNQKNVVALSEFNTITLSPFGALTPEHCVIWPRDHFLNYSRAEDDEMRDLHDLQSKLIEAFGEGGENPNPHKKIIFMETVTFRDIENDKHAMIDVLPFETTKTDAEILSIFRKSLMDEIEDFSNINNRIFDIRTKNRQDVKRSLHDSDPRNFFPRKGDFSYFTMYLFSNEKQQSSSSSSIPKELSQNFPEKSAFSNTKKDQSKASGDQLFGFCLSIEKKFFPKAFGIDVVLEGVLEMGSSKVNKKKFFSPKDVQESFKNKWKD